MAGQETASSTITSLNGRPAGLLAALVVVAAIGIGIEYVSSLLDLELPFRQFMLGRNWNALTMYRRFAWIVLGGYVLAMLAGSPTGYLSSFRWRASIRYLGNSTFAGETVHRWRDWRRWIDGFLTPPGAQGSRREMPRPARSCSRPPASRGQPAGHAHCAEPG